MGKRLWFGMLLLAGSLFASAGAQVLRPGVDYERVPGGQSWQPLNGKIEVAEVFAYWCPHCDHMQPVFSDWAAKQKPDIRIALIPSGDDDAARAAFAMQAAGIAPRAHAAVFRAIHTDQSLPRHPTAEEMATFLSTFGVPAPKLLAIMKSPETDAQLQRSRAFMISHQVSGTPTVVVNGRYKVYGATMEQEIANLDAVIRDIRKGILK